MGQTITIYPKKTPEDLESNLISYQIDFETFLTSQSSKYRMGAPALNIKRYIKRIDAEHELHHQDDLNREEKHYHIELNDPINQATFNGVLDALFNDNLITNAEMLRIKDAYNKANLLEKNVLIASTPLCTETASLVPTKTASPVRTSSFKASIFQLASVMQRSIARIPSQPFMPKY